MISRAPQEAKMAISVLLSVCFCKEIPQPDAFFLTETPGNVGFVPKNQVFYLPL